jgi:myo-inositol 2-dehydrogenase / D-chiro-inositol 1-dehydrogenase
MEAVFRQASAFAMLRAAVVKFVQFGAGRIGGVHAANMGIVPGAQLAYVVDVAKSAAEALAARHGAKAASQEEALADPSVDAVLIASATSTHVDLIIAAARAKKAIFCEKPIDLDLAKADRAIAAVEAAGVPFFVGFNRRFDPNFAALKAAADAGKVGAIETVTITSRDPAPPPVEYIKVSGGIFRDMMIHDFDMARWLLPEEPVAVFAAGSNLVSEEIERAGDVDTACVILETAGGALCQISNSRRAVYGYDQRIEVFGSQGMLRAENPLETTVLFSGEPGGAAAKLPYFFLERYSEAYRREMTYFVKGLEAGTAFSGAADGRGALLLAEAALRSLRSGKKEKV